MNKKGTTITICAMFAVIIGITGFLLFCGVLMGLLIGGTFMDITSTAMLVWLGVSMLGTIILVPTIYLNSGEGDKK
ncbi:gp34.52 [Bacillus phage SPO1]|uniref:Gp34.52 n=1 Tax=Bacillus phage SP01 TaxID=2884427 RepID=B6V302_BPSP1|nr:gp34.52 [Bacillus phage SPO1]ACI91084.1 gp34.52 [Bacillus phage SPO1]